MVFGCMLYPDVANAKKQVTTLKMVDNLTKKGYTYGGQIITSSACKPCKH